MSRDPRTDPIPGDSIWYSGTGRVVEWCRYHRFPDGVHIGVEFSDGAVAKLSDLASAHVISIVPEAG